MQIYVKSTEFFDGIQWQEQKEFHSKVIKSCIKQDDGHEAIFCRSNHKVWQFAERRSSFEWHRFIVKTGKLLRSHTFYLHFFGEIHQSES